MPASLPLVFLAPLACAPPFHGSGPPSQSVSCPWPLRPQARKGGSGVLWGGLCLHHFPSSLVELLPRECLQPLPLPLWTHGGGAAGSRSCCSPDHPVQGCLLPTGRLSVQVHVRESARVCICVLRGCNMVTYSGICPTVRTQARIHLQPPLPAPHANKEPGQDVKPLPHASFPHRPPTP